MTPPDTVEATTTRYDSKRLTLGGAVCVEDIKRAAERLAALIDAVPGRPASVALTHLQAAVMFAVRAVAETHHE